MVVTHLFQGASSASHGYSFAVSWCGRGTAAGLRLAAAHPFLPLMISRLLRHVSPLALHPWLDRVRASPLGRRMAHGMFWSVAGAVVSRSLALLLSILTARLLLKEVFGQLGMVQSTLNMFGTFASFGMGLTATKYVAEYRLTDPARAGRIIGMSSMISWISGAGAAVAMVGVAPWIAKHALNAPQLTLGLRVAAICLLFGILNEAQLGTLSGLEAFKRRSKIQVAGSLVATPVALAGVYGWGLTGAICGLGFSQFLLVVLNYLGIQKEARAAGVAISWRLRRQEIEVFWRFSLPTLFGALVYVPAMWFANAIIVNTKGGFAEMGEFSAGDRWRTAIGFLPALIAGVVLPMLASLSGESDAGRYHKVLWANVKLSFGLSLAAAMPIALLSHWIMASYGPGFSEGRWVLVTLCAVSVITSTSYILAQSLVSDGRVWTMLILNLSWASVLLTSCWFLRANGAVGLAFAYLASEGSRLLSMFLVTKWRRPNCRSEAFPPTPT